MNFHAMNLSDYARQIDSHHREAEKAAATALEHAIECGRLLTLAKEKVAYGDWCNWLEENVSVGERQAQKYMALFRRRDILQEPNRGSDLSIRQAVKLIEQPRPIFEEVEGGTVRVKVAPIEEVKAGPVRIKYAPEPELPGYRPIKPENCRYRELADPYSDYTTPPSIGPTSYLAALSRYARAHTPEEMAEALDGVTAADIEELIAYLAEVASKMESAG